MATVRPAKSEADLEAVRRLFAAYVDELDIPLDFQDVGDELDELPGPYAAPEGAILLAEVEKDPAGVVAVKPLSETRVCEMKRLYVRPEYRGQGIGRELGEAIVKTARSLGYDTMRLDTMASMKPARSLYRSLGFEERDPYYDNPLDNVVFMERPL